MVLRRTRLFFCGAEGSETDIVGDGFLVYIDNSKRSISDFCTNWRQIAFVGDKLVIFSGRLTAEFNIFWW